MGKILVNTNNEVFAYAPRIEYGFYEEDCYKWCMSDDEKIFMYVIDFNSQAISEEECMFKSYSVDEVPENFEPYKYLFVDSKFIENPNWVEPPKSDAERIAELETIVAEQKLQLQQADDTAIELFEAQLAQEEINQAQDDALIELWEIVEQQGGGE